MTRVHSTPRSCRPRRVVKWTGIALIATVGAAALLSGFVKVAWILPGHQVFQLIGGGISWFWPRGPFQIGSSMTGGSLDVQWHPWCANLFGWRLSYGVSGALSEGWLPLWLPLVVLAAPTAWAWRADAHGHGLCPTCRYDLAGNTTGICPECGLATPQSQLDPAAGDHQC
jgi:hypothetical protein